MNFKSFRSKYEKKHVEEYPNQVPNNVKVSVCVQTFQHVDYIKECLDSILEQKTEFTYEILLGDDFSSDGTREICLAYAKKHPSKIRLFLHHRENNIKIDGTATGKFNFLFNLYNAQGTYIAICEGDDHWIDPLKLQRQVDFLENNLNYSLSTENSRIIDEIANTTSLFSNVSTSTDYLTADMLKKRKFHTASIVFKKENLKLPDNFTDFPIEDTILFISLAKQGKVHYAPNISSIYRLNEGGATRIKNRLQWAKTIEKFYLLLYEYLNFDYSKIIYQNIYNHYKAALIWAIHNKGYNNIPLASIKYLEYYIKLLMHKS